MELTELRKLVGEGGHIFRVKFVKRDGSERTMLARLGVKSKLRGGVKAYRDEDYGILTVYDMDKGEYRSIRAESIISLKAHGKEHGG